MKHRRLVLMVLLFLLMLPAAATGQESGPVDGGDTAWMLVSTALVMLMTPGVALFYGGIARRKNVLNTIMLSFIVLCVISVQWILWGYTLVFGPDKGGIIGGLDFLALDGVAMTPTEGSTIPHQLFMIFQGMFAILAAALVAGAFVGRIKFFTFIVFIPVWVTLVYDPIAHWVWGGGWIGALGALDYAGGTVVHISAGVSALVASKVIGKRKDFPVIRPNNLPLTILGAALLWFGWFGFNAGSALAADGSAAIAFVTTNTSSAAAALTWMMLEWIHKGKPTALGTASGAIAGLVSITPAAGFVGIMSSIIIGIGASIFCYTAVTRLKPALGYDDSLDVFGIHGVGGTWGAIATGLFASAALGGNDGLIFGNPGQLTKQAIVVAASWTLAAAGTYVVLKVLDWVMGLRVGDDDEVKGLDVSQHGEAGYDF